ncbi:Dihydrolipoyllysine-residue acetyltransferase component of pyruvate dehydrogenase complex [Poriferisphaera corsica]|uniref:Acetyltransferase component of pyruvate dehydrogenase complex n=1 Tax=Poriferisphaera corsica TaxID=2528020 RepID=A0A517YPG7_9BACT|nr:pyruvate dehydrogenase complex dihydrolipoamide acetyltransferase [Poriferisphaera corsica]QDU32118.1 Dihydrolipoyllysine-residue acetyltransferase component of pyruvate dehydrogenase complex [Poriferisphaera corsica]
MAIEITMPRLSDTMEEGTLVKWHVSVGDKVASGDHLADVETDKATMELQAFDDGTLAKLALEAGNTVPVGSLIAVLAEDGESVEDAAASAGSGSSTASTAPAPAAEAAPVATATATAAPAAPAGTRVSPLARKLAAEHNVDISTVQGTGPDGRIIKRDILAAAQGGASAASVTATPVPATPAATIASVASELKAEEIQLNGMRKTIAKRLVESKTTIPHFQVTVAVDMDPILELRKTLNSQLENQGVKLSVNDFIVRASALALVQHPTANSSWAGDKIIQHGTVNIGIAVALPAERGGGLIVPTLRDVHVKGMRQISTETKTLATKAREVGLTPEEMSDGTFTISNLGMYGVEAFTAIISPPQSAILAIGGAVQKPVVKNGEIVIGHVMNATISADHRVLDGAVAAEFMNTLKSLLENPAGLLV